MELTENIELNNNNFFETTFGSLINNSIETGIRALLPDFLENDAIEIKNTFINQGFPEAIKQLVNKVIDLGKNAVSTIKSGIENIGQLDNIFEKGDLINGVSEVIDYFLNTAEKNNLLSEDVIKIIKNGKNFILNGVSSDVKNELKIENDNINKLDNYNKKWREAYENQDFKTMEKNIKKINKLMENIAPIESIINEANTIKNLHSLIENNGQNFNISYEENEIAKILK
ncbi:MAG: hypothetical protein IKE91_00255 [Clostridia bacterium]|nr:hypothetical protein [Clostridia bacterium]